MKNKSFKYLMKQILYMFLGNGLLAMAVSFFILPNDLLTGGVACLAIDLSMILPISRIALIYILNIGMFLLGWLTLGRSFAAKTALSTILYPMLISFFDTLDTAPFTTVDPLLCSLYAGLLMGAGLGLIFSVNGSTGGMDIPALLLNKYLHISLNNAVMIVDGLTILFGVYYFGLNALLVGLLSVFSSNFAINWVSTLGSQNAKDVIIISDHWQAIRDHILDHTQRGITILEGAGGYTGQKKPVLLCVVTSRQYPRLADQIAAIDPKAFLVVSDVKEVRGLGFSYLPENMMD